MRSERTRHRNRLSSKLVTPGIGLPISQDFLARLEAVKLFDGSEPMLSMGRAHNGRHRCLDSACTMGCPATRRHGKKVVEAGPCPLKLTPNAVPCANCKPHRTEPELV